MDDAELVERIGERNEFALKELYDRHDNDLLNAARKLLPGGGAEDVVQEVIVALWDDPSRYDPARGTVAAFLVTQVKSRALDSLRREGAYRRAKDRASERLDAILEPVTRADKTGLESALESLPQDQRALLERMYFEGESQSEIAQNTGLSLGTVKSRIRLGMSKLKDAFARFTGGRSLPRPPAAPEA